MTQGVSRRNGVGPAALRGGGFFCGAMAAVGMILSTVATAAPPEALASLHLYNPTAWAGPADRGLGWRGRGAGSSKMDFYRLVEGDAGGKQALGCPRVTLVSSSSNAALAELHFVLEAGDRLAMALTYRVHPSGLVEICSDERPWQGVSPGVDHTVEYALCLEGEEEVLPYRVNRAPFYGFKDYAAAVRHVAAIHRTPQAAVLELGEETVNGRRWNRRLYLIPAGKTARVGNGRRAVPNDLAELADEGLIITVTPKSTRLTGCRRAGSLSCASGCKTPASAPGYRGWVTASNSAARLRG